MNTRPVDQAQVTAANPAWAPSTKPVTVHFDGLGVGTVADMVTGAMVADGCRIESTNDYQVVYEKDVAAGVAVTPDAVCGQLTGPVYWVTAIFVADSLGVTVTASRDLIRNPRTECMARIPASTADLQVVLERLESEMERSSSR